jgi:hypothetical protein
MWTDDKLGNYVYRPEGKTFAVCGMHPKPTMAYLKYLGNEFFDDEKDFEDWYYHKNFWHGGTAPCEIPIKDAITRILQAIHGVYI